MTNKYYKPNKIHVDQKHIDEIIKSVNKTGRAKVHRLGEFKATRFKNSNTLTGKKQTVKALRVGFKPSKAFKNKIK